MKIDLGLAFAQLKQKKNWLDYSVDYGNYVRYTCYLTSTDWISYKLSDIASKCIVSGSTSELAEARIKYATELQKREAYRQGLSDIREKLKKIPERVELFAQEEA